MIGQRKSEQEDRQILHRGLAVGNFKQVFKLADHVKVAKATLENGLLSIDLVRDIPEELKPRRINVTAAERTSSVQHTGENKQISQDTGRRARQPDFTKPSTLRSASRPIPGGTDCGERR